MDADASAGASGASPVSVRTLPQRSITQPRMAPPSKTRSAGPRLETTATAMAPRPVASGTAHARTAPILASDSSGVSVDGGGGGSRYGDAARFFLGRRLFSVIEVSELRIQAIVVGVA